MSSIFGPLRSHAAARGMRKQARRYGGIGTAAHVVEPGRVDALVTDVHTRWGLAGVRDLGRAGLNVIALGHDPAAAGVWSRHAAAWAVGPDSAGEPERFARGIGELAE